MCENTAQKFIGFAQFIWVSVAFLFFLPAIVHGLLPGTHLRLDVAYFLFRCPSLSPIRICLYEFWSALFGESNAKFTLL